MSGFSITSRGFCAGVVAATIARPALARPEALTAQPARVQLAHARYGAAEVWSYDETFPGPSLRFRQGTRLTRQLVNRLDFATSVHGTASASTMPWTVSRG
ncbi:multicopper oxidase domain-containing protein [Litorisediminicola beolgyonensis]|uniref:Multicopper oxidase domain-containing protein n=1 Tax=Litorisediminicola beolgyonensis TaxID=1173614 RepID=A0ABW3ZKP8_9RHOB